MGNQIKAYEAYLCKCAEIGKHAPKIVRESIKKAMVHEKRAIDGNRTRVAETVCNCVGRNSRPRARRDGLNFGRDSE